MQQLDIIAEKSNLPQVLAFVDGQLENHNCPAKFITQIDLAVEEVFTNISSYAYDPDVGIASVQVDITDEPFSVKISFIDSGSPYDPLAKPDPDVKVPLKQRRKGGLGIYLVKKSMDDVKYEYKNGQNILTFIKTEK